MKVDIKRREELRGLIFKTKFYNVSVDVKMTEEEKQVLKENEQEKAVLIPGTTNMPFITTVREFMRDEPWEVCFRSLREANEYADLVLPAARNLKNYIDANTNRPTETSVEL